VSGMFGKKKKKAKANEQAVTQTATKPKIIPGGNFFSNVTACLAGSRQTILTILILVALIFLLLWLDDVLPTGGRKDTPSSGPRTETTQQKEDAASTPPKDAASEPAPYIPPQDSSNTSDWENAVVDTSPDFSWGDESGGEADFWDDMDPDSEGAVVSLPGGGQAPESDFIFPHSSDTLLTDADLDAAFADNASMRSQRAINEIYARYGYNFHPEKSATAQDAYDYFHTLDWYNAICQTNTASNTGAVPVNKVENANIQKIASWQTQHGLR